MAERKRRRNNPWTQEQIATLAREWNLVSARTLTGKLRPHTWVSIRRKSEDLGLPHGIPQGCASLYSLAQRCGISLQPFVRILEAEGVQTHSTYPACSLPAYLRRKSQRRYAEVDEAIEAFNRWLGRETLNDAAQRLGDRSALYRRARRAGLYGSGRVLRLRPEQWDAIYAIPAWARAEQVAEAVAKAGLESITRKDPQ